MFKTLFNLFQITVSIHLEFLNEIAKCKLNSDASKFVFYLVRNTLEIVLNFEILSSKLFE